MEKIKVILISVIAGAIGAVLTVALVGGQSAKLAGVTNYDSLTLSPTNMNEGLKVGTTSADTFVNMKHGTCNAQTATASFSASTTAQFVCSATGVRSGDQVFAFLPVGAGANANGAGSPFGGFDVVATNASTSDQFGFTIQNNTGAATSSYAQATTAVSYFIVR